MKSKGVQAMTIQDKLYNKVSAEYNARIAEIEQLSPQQIIRRAYEIVTKADLLMCFDAGEIEDTKAHVLLQLDAPLDTLYEQWLEVDASKYMDRLRDCIDTEARFQLKMEVERIMEKEERMTFIDQV